MIKREDLDRWFKYHPPIDVPQIATYQRIRTAGRTMALRIFDDCPDSREKTVAIRKIREAVMYANAAIACNQGEPVTAPASSS